MSVLVSPIARYFNLSYNKLSIILKDNIFYGTGALKDLYSVLLGAAGITSRYLHLLPDMPYV